MSASGPSNTKTCAIVAYIAPTLAPEECFNFIIQYKAVSEKTLLRLLEMALNLSTRAPWPLAMG